MDELKQLKEDLERAWDNYEKKQNSLDIGTLSLQEWEAALNPYTEKINNINHKIKLIEDIEWGDIPEYGDLMTMKDWLYSVECGGFIDYDGHGNYSDGERLAENKMIKPSHVKNNRILKNPEFTHVVWFNR